MPECEKDNQTLSTLIIRKNNNNSKFRLTKILERNTNGSVLVFCLGIIFFLLINQIFTRFEMSPFLPTSTAGGVATVGAGAGMAETFLAERRTSSKNWNAFRIPKVLLKITWKCNNKCYYSVLQSYLQNVGNLFEYFISSKLMNDWHS